VPHGVCRPAIAQCRADEFAEVGWAELAAWCAAGVAAMVGEEYHPRGTRVRIWPRLVTRVAVRRHGEGSGVCARWSGRTVAGAEWGKRQGLPANQRWTELLPPELAYVAKSLGRPHVIAGGLQAPWQPRSST